MRGIPLLVLVAGVGALTLECAHEELAQQPPPSPPLDEGAVAALIPAKIKDRAGWAADVVAAIRVEKKEPTAERVCAVLAVIEQESGYQADPPVADLPGIVRRGIDERLAALGPLAGTTRDALLDERVPGSELTFGQRIAKLKTERDLDRFFRDVERAYRDQMPGAVAVASALSTVLGKGSIEDLNPVTTAGSMQVKVSFARELGKGEGLDDEGVRELLYTRGGGVRFGTARLIGYAAHYDDITFRFADYNAGMYASRNAAFQAMLSEVTGEKLVEDGDVLAYDKNGKPRDVDTNTLKAMLAFGALHDLSSWTVHRDAKKEKSAAFEDTDSWRAVRAAWEEKTKKAAPYAKIPAVALVSPKLKSPRTTAWYAASVKKRYDACRAKAPP